MIIWKNSPMTLFPRIPKFPFPQVPIEILPQVYRSFLSSKQVPYAIVGKGNFLGIGKWSYPKLTWFQLSEYSLTTPIKGY
jgi:hypothetical protein